ncbi:MAG: ATP-binding protein [Fischerella sp. CENA71]|nr:ATP-binding protein [Fischerella sp. CENA71]
MLAINLLRFLATSTFLRTRLFAPLYASFFVLVLLIVGQQALNIWIVYLNQQAVNSVNHTLLVEGEGERLLNAVIDEERAALQGHIQGRSAFRSSFNRLYNLVEDNPTQLKQLDLINHLHTQWQSQLGEKKLFGSTNRDIPTEKNLFNSLRTQIRVLLLREEILLDERKHRLQQLYNFNTAVNIFSTVLILLGIACNLRLLYRRVEFPLRNLIKIGDLWQAGQLEAQLGYSSGDEIGRLTEVLNLMVSKASQRQKNLKIRNQQLEDLISAISHDIRTPLLATRTTLDSMMKGAFGSVNDTWREVFEEYRQANEDLLKLVEVLLNVSRYEAGYSAQLNCEPLNWENIFVKTIARIKACSQHNFIFTYEISQSLPTVYGDEIEIQRVLQNLLDNAVRVSEPNTNIFLEVATLGETQVRVSVRDYGPGIAPQDKEKLFYRFVQGRGRRGKSGLGLYLCRQIIEAHGGTIGVESSFGEGSTFWFALPVPLDKAEFSINRCMRRNHA